MSGGLGVKLPKFKVTSPISETVGKKQPMRNAALDATGRIMSAQLERTLQRAQSLQALTTAGDLDANSHLERSTDVVEATGGGLTVQTGVNPGIRVDRSRLAFGGPSKLDIVSPVAPIPTKTNLPSNSAVMSAVMFKLGGALPETALPTRFHRFDETPVYGSDAKSYYNRSTGRLQARTFPSQNPSSREDAVSLSTVLDVLLEEIELNDGMPEHSTSPPSAVSRGIEDAVVGGHAHKVGADLKNIVTFGDQLWQSDVSSDPGAQQQHRTPRELRRTKSSVTAEGPIATTNAVAASLASLPKRTVTFSDGTSSSDGGRQPSAAVSRPPPISSSSSRGTPAQRGSILTSPIAVTSSPDSSAVRAMFRQRLTQDLPAWELVFFEVVRQVFVGCEERGVLLERIRHRYLSFRRDFERAWKAVEEFAVFADGDRQNALERAALAEATKDEANRARLEADNRVMDLNDELHSREAELGKLRAKCTVQESDLAHMSRKLESAHRAYRNLAEKYDFVQDQLSVLEKSANNSAVSSSVATAPLKPIQDEGMARRLMSRGSTGWSEGFRDEDVFEGNAGSHAARNVSPALSGAFVSPELRRSPIMTPRSAGVNPSSGDRQFVFGDGGKSPKHGGSPKHNGSPKSFSGPRPPSVVGVRGRSPSPERSDNVFQSSSVSALSNFDQFIQVRSPVREMACQTDLGGEELSSSLQSSSKASTLSPTTEGHRSSIRGGDSPSGKGRSSSRGTRNNDRGEAYSDEGSSCDEDGGRRYNSKAHIRVGGSRRRVPLGYGPDGERLGEDGESNNDDEVTGYADGDRDKLGSGGPDGQKLSRHKGLKASLSVDTVGDAEYLSWDPVTRQRKRLGQLMASEPKLSRLEKLQKFRDRFRVPLVWRSLVGSDDGIKFPEGKIAPLNKVHLGMWQVMIDKIKSDATNQRDKLPCDEFPDFVANHLMFSFGTKGVVQDRLTSLITSLQEYIPVDNTCYMFARFCKLLDPVPLEAASTVLRVLSVTFNCRFPLPVLPPPNKPVEIVFQLKRGLEALRTIGSAMKFANWRKAQERLVAYSMFAVTGPDRSIETLDAFMNTLPPELLMYNAALTRTNSALPGTEDGNPPGYTSSLPSSPKDSNAQFGLFSPSGRTTVARGRTGSDGEGGDYFPATLDDDTAKGKPGGNKPGANSRQPSRKQRRVNWLAAVSVFDLADVAFEMWRDSFDSTRSHLVNLFQECDKNGNGLMEFDEFLYCLKRFAESFSEATDKDGTSRASSEKSTLASSSLSSPTSSTISDDVTSTMFSDESTARRLFDNCTKTSKSGLMNADEFVQVVQGFLGEALQKEFAGNRGFLSSLTGVGEPSITLEFLN